MSDVRGQLTADRHPARELMRFARTGSDGSLASRSIARRLLRIREALMFLPAFGTFPSVVSAFVMSHKPELRPVLE